MVETEKYIISEEEERKLILREYRSLLRALKLRLKRGDKKLVRRAFEIAADAHQHMRRKSGEPYILHPLAVAKIVVEEMSLGVTSVICALLHDTVEDTEVTLKEIEMEFGSTCAKIIEGLTKISSVVESKDTTQQAENFKKILLTLADDPRVILIKIADRLHNMRTLDSMSREKQLKISSETTFLYAPLANRLGLYEIKSELEDLALKYTETDVYEEIIDKLKNTKRERTRYINEFIKPIKEELEKNNFQFDITGRPKSIHSILHKMRTKHVTFEEVYDLFAIRIILKTENEKEDCWKVFSIVTDLYNYSKERLRDWISTPKSNGYEALHATVMGPAGRWVEVQIRTQRMNEIAEKGLAAHWKYKEGKAGQESKLDDWLKHIKELLSNPDSNALDFIQDIKSDIFLDEIYIYTPQGDMRILPAGSTALDFAFDIHSELGKNCIGAKVNYKLVPLSYPLKNADQIEIITSKKQKPHNDWLKFVKTAKAKSRIKYYLKEEKRITAQSGKEILLRKLEHLKIPVTTVLLNDLASYYKFPSPLDMHFAIAVGSFEMKELSGLKYNGEKLVFQNEVKRELPKEVPHFEDAKEIPGKGYELILFGENSDKILYKLANCCQPIPGDDVFGFVTSGEGLKIHRTNCPNAASLLANYGHRVVKAKWAKNKEISFLTGVKINGIDDVGIINKITNVVSGELKMNMRSMSIDSSDGLFEGTIMVFVNHKEELNALCEKLEALEGINKVVRLDAD
ncbi:MAG: bifunctional (p)ppGpp synthetase/guanosine-3',5'-bis(diphosphate) 3'-pyrophosphohydrolase [Bacteroidetes bacterium]|nr:bifunctional (p)ppGpp synthetase/guanosine-3',5'-bis(diphosphate) 3'-pyrophosphohydrolase [Bacteroidota bacterium]MBK8145465.1 bifunctional (p)ppGpp synthetase/guanosine-3',5'-bis(diphosphate) 3'-pyrophosphohydrolase [Bacteroidota bacterium]MBP6315995.1 bifunctional (p)ppGpp synthetase/guanosine-3',5'-bis(diphosphate) 3'-pyrophosphohydrolase [Chitinophagaceae bacterium]